MYKILLARKPELFRLPDKLQHMHVQLHRSTRIFNSTTYPNLHFSRKLVLSRFETYNVNILHKKYQNICKIKYASCFSLISRVRVIFRAAGTSTVDSLRKREQLTREIQYIWLMRKALTDQGLRISRSDICGSVIFEGVLSSPKLPNENQRCDLANMLQGRISTLIT